ncbi:hypothetical protein ACOCEA_00435 [Maribacter sp. CXY002]|uniref:hypothetical protein n=1 Tax=Maribacter luteocoastalis TaxID=3407671 RepID=UPI003B676537
MKTIFVTLFLIASSITSRYSQETLTMTGTFNHYANEVYVFTDEEGNNVEFQDISSDALDVYDLTDKKFEGMLFQVVYTTDIDEDDEDLEIFTIESLKKLE